MNLNPETPISVSYDNHHAIVLFNCGVNPKAIATLVETLRHLIEGLQYDRIELQILSPGGDIPALHYYIAALQKWKNAVHFHTRALTDVSSASAIMLSLGDKRTASVASQLLYHHARYTHPPGAITSKAAEKMQHVLDHNNSYILDLLSERAADSNRITPRSWQERWSETDPDPSITIFDANVFKDAIPPLKEWQHHFWPETQEAQETQETQETQEETPVEFLKRVYDNVFQIDKSIPAELARKIGLIDHLLGVKKSSTEQVKKSSTEQNAPSPALQVPEWKALFPGGGRVSKKDLTRHFMILGETGSGKTMSGVLPIVNAIVASSDSPTPTASVSCALIIDPKREIAAAIAKMRESRGVQVTNLSQVNKPHVLNVMPSHQEGSDLMTSASNILKRMATLATANSAQVLFGQSPIGHQDPYWPMQGARLATTALGLVLWVLKHRKQLYRPEHRLNDLFPKDTDTAKAMTWEQGMRMLAARIDTVAESIKTAAVDTETAAVDTETAAVDTGTAAVDTGTPRPNHYFIFQLKRLADKAGLRSTSRSPYTTKDKDECLQQLETLKNSHGLALQHQTDSTICIDETFDALDTLYLDGFLRWVVETGERSVEDSTWTGEPNEVTLGRIFSDHCSLTEPPPTSRAEFERQYREEAEIFGYPETTKDELEQSIDRRIRDAETLRSREIREIRGSRTVETLASAARQSAFFGDGLMMSLGDVRPCTVYGKPANDDLEQRTLEVPVVGRDPDKPTEKERQGVLARLTRETKANPEAQAIHDRYAHRLQQLDDEWRTADPTGDEASPDLDVKGSLLLTILQDRVNGPFGWRCADLAGGDILPVLNSEDPRYGRKDYVQFKTDVAIDLGMDDPDEEDDMTELWVEFWEKLHAAPFKYDPKTERFLTDWGYWKLLEAQLQRTEEYQIHEECIEGPIGPRSEETLEPGHVVEWQFGAYPPGRISPRAFDSVLTYASGDRSQARDGNEAVALARRCVALSQRRAAIIDEYGAELCDCLRKGQGAGEWKHRIEETVRKRNESINSVLAFRRKVTAAAAPPADEPATAESGISKVFRLPPLDDEIQAAVKKLPEGPGAISGDDNGSKRWLLDEGEDNRHGVNVIALAHHVLDTMMSTSGVAHIKYWKHLLENAMKAEWWVDSASAETEDLLRDVRKWVDMAGDAAITYGGVRGEASLCLHEFAQSSVSQILYFGCEPAWRAWVKYERDSIVDFARALRDRMKTNIFLFQPDLQGTDLVARALKARFFETVLSDSNRQNPGFREQEPLAAYVADEFHRFITADRSHGEQSFLDTCRSFGVFCVLATQSLESMNNALLDLEGSAKVSAAISILSNNTGNKFFFRTTDLATKEKVRALAPVNPGSGNVVDARPLSTLQPGECYAVLVDGRFERVQLGQWLPPQRDNE